jgi:hypothetical protein
LVRLSIQKPLAFRTTQESHSEINIIVAECHPVVELEVRFGENHAF